MYNSCRSAGCVDDQQLTGHTLTWVDSASSGNSVDLCRTVMQALSQNRHQTSAAALFVCGLASFDCIMYNKTSDKIKITAAGKGLKWHRTVKQASCDLIPGDVC